ncbi:helix-turn-helix transcriptional regulator [Nonomuraea sp. NPDC046802]|uniref:helix-turn-helix domain-containing protein n=1 Tax=Nonomuraea sp. NPDC046802 TaxID=3154919 RepID=UPI0033EF9149
MRAGAYLDSQSERVVTCLPQGIGGLPVAGETHMTDTTARHCRCGTRLARDNATGRCAACTTHARSTTDTPVGPPRVPPVFWDHPEMRAALDKWHMGKVIAAYRAHPHHVRPLRQETVAAWVGITQPQLSRIENGPPMTDLGRLTQWARLLGIPPERLWFQVPEQRTPPSVPLLTSAAPPPTPSGAGGDAAVMATWRTVDAQIGGAHLYATVTAYLRDQVGPRLLFGGGGSEVFTVAAALTEMCGWMAHDAGRDDRAEHHFRRAWDLSGGRSPSRCSRAGQPRPPGSPPCPARHRRYLRRSGTASADIGTTAPRAGGPSVRVAGSRSRCPRPRTRSPRLTALRRNRPPWQLRHRTVGMGEPF